MPYDNRQPLTVPCLDGVYRQLGVTTDARSAQSQAVVTWETISIHTSLRYQDTPVVDTAIVAAQLTTRIITDLDQVITELTSHRDRLRTELADLLATIEVV